MRVHSQYFELNMGINFTDLQETNIEFQEQVCSSFALLLIFQKVTVIYPFGGISSTLRCAFLTRLSISPTPSQQIGMQRNQAKRTLSSENLDPEKRRGHKIADPPCQLLCEVAFHQFLQHRSSEGVLPLLLFPSTSLAFLCL